MAFGNIPKDAGGFQSPTGWRGHSGVLAFIACGHCHNVSIPNGLERPFRLPVNRVSPTIAVVFQSPTGWRGHSGCKPCLRFAILSVVSIPNGL